MRYLVAIEFSHAPQDEFGNYVPHYRTFKDYDEAIEYIQRFPTCNQSVCYDFEEKRIRMHCGSGSFNISHEDMELVITKMILTES